MLALKWSSPPSDIPVEISIELICDDDSNPTIEFLPPVGTSSQLIDLSEFPAVALESAVGVLITIWPRFDYWAAVTVSESLQGMVRLDCTQVEWETSASIWWANTVGVEFSDENGEGIKIGIVDLNISCETSALEKISHLGHATLNSFSADDRHGSLVASFLAGNSKQCRIPGLIPKADIFFLSAADRQGYLSPNAVSDAIEILSTDHSCDIIVVSAGDSEHPQPHVREAVARAQSSGTICFFAAGNAPGAVSYPAKYPDVIAVGTLGKRGALPKNSRMQVTHEVDDGRLYLDRSGNFYISEFLTFGEEVNLLAPGIGVIGDFGDGHLYPVCGSSFAAPIAAGSLAVALGRVEGYSTSLGIDRFNLAKNALESSLLKEMFEGLHDGVGCPCATVQQAPTV